jgi:two-component system chemotaxis response regulator CheB
MPGQFTGPFAARLNANSAIEVKEAERGDVLRPNRALIAPGGKHLRIRKRGADVVAGLLVGETVSGHMPSVDVMMKDVANLYRHRCLGVIMTGMGSDGADGCAAIRRNGGYVLGQDEATSDVYGMNKVAFTQGHVDEQFSLETLPQLLKSQCEHQFRALTGPPPARASSS